jgi:hypothetical protein
MREALDRRVGRTTLKKHRIVYSALAILVATVASVPGLAYWDYGGGARAIALSDVAVIGVLDGVETWRERRPTGTSWPSYNCGSGHITVEQVLMGEAAAGDTLLLEWEWPSAIACPTIHHEHHVGRRMLWLLRGPENGIFAAPGPVYAVPLGGREFLESYVRRSGIHKLSASDRVKVEPVLEYLNTLIGELARGHPNAGERRSN